MQLSVHRRTFAVSPKLSHACIEMISLLAEEEEIIKNKISLLIKK
jgi:hypothetical protein